MRRFLRRKRSDRGANLVEFAMVMPFLLLLLLGIVEFSWTFATNLDVKQGAREAARITAVNEPDGGGGDANDALRTEICKRMDLVGEDAATSITWTGVDLDGNGIVEVGDGVEVEVSTPHTTLTGFLDWAFTGIDFLESKVEIRIEQTPDWTNGTRNCL